MFQAFTSGAVPTPTLALTPGSWLTPNLTPIQKLENKKNRKKREVAKKRGQHNFPISKKCLQNIFINQTLLAK